MQKVTMVGLIGFILVGLAGCAKNEQSESTTSKSIVETTTSSSLVSDDASKSSQTQDSSTSQSQLSSNASTETSQKGTETDAPLEHLQSLYPNQKVPTDISYQNQFLNLAVADEGTRFSVLYYSMDQKLGLNSKQLNQETPLAHFEKNSYSTEQAAQQAVNPITDLNGGKVDLGYGITGYTQGAAGSSYLTWKEGNWYLTVQASNLANQDPVPTAKEVVVYLEKNYLPAPKSVGQITLSIASHDYQSNRVVWQVGKEVYTVTHQEPLAALKMAVSMGK